MGRVVYVPKHLADVVRVELFGRQRIEVRGVRLERAGRHQTASRSLVIDQQGERQPLRPFLQLGVRPAQCLFDGRRLPGGRQHGVQSGQYVGVRVPFAVAGHHVRGRHFVVTTAVIR